MSKHKCSECGEELKSTVEVEEEDLCEDCLEDADYYGSNMEAWDYE